MNVAKDADVTDAAAVGEASIEVTPMVEATPVESAPVEKAAAEPETLLELAKATPASEERPDGEELPERLKFDIQIAGEVDSADLPKTLVVGGNLKAEPAEATNQETPLTSSSEASLRLDDAKKEATNEKCRAVEMEEEEDDFYGQDDLGSARRSMTPADMRNLRNRGGRRAKTVWFQRFCCM